MNSPGLFDTLEAFPGIGKLKARTLARLGLHRGLDVVFFFPRDYEDHSQVRAISEMRNEETGSVIGEVRDFELLEKGRGRSTFYLLLEQGNHSLRGIWFNQPYRANRIEIGKRVMLSGKARFTGSRLEMVHPRLTLIEDGNDEPPSGSLLPVYRLTDGVRQAEMRKIVRQVVGSCLESVNEIFPDSYRQSKDLPHIQSALAGVHFPETPDEIEPARNRFVYQELLTLQLAVQLRRQQVSLRQAAPPMENSGLIDSRIKKYFPYELTSSQLQSIDEICNDMARPVPMNRMLHGDVGCGKTSVAVYALMLAVANGHQGVLMAPTETLARQHFRHLRTSLAAARVGVELLTGSLSRKEKAAALQRIENGEAGIIIGTQALLQNTITFHHLGLVIVDEQHRFGVQQRSVLRHKGITPHYLVMTATPIPRTVSMTLFGDLDVSVIDEKPPNRPAVNTYLCKDSQKEKWWEFVRKKVREGRQAYVIAPLVNEDEDSAWESVEKTFENLANGELADFKTDLVHGRQSATEKDLAMERFASGETEVLVATSVVEVGIDVPNASVMTILSASRFGLAQLHQLRGRVCRGTYAGFVALFSDQQAEEGRDRLHSLVETDNGFELAEKDFQLRGPGELFGTRQHGMPPLYVADLQRDGERLIQARQDAREILAGDPELQSADFSPLRERVLARYGPVLDLGDVG
ncbi:MAG: ATP-dependent DNA helicase RecG [Planctomycetota bacterium]|nr:ATP-dependent DNA helicase RecG [Planctomycetota bacterium]